MRFSLLVMLVVAATPAVAAPVAPQIPAAPQIPREILDGTAVDQLQPMFKALARAFLNLPVGEIEAAAEGRSARPDEARRTVGDATGMSEAELNREIAASSGALKAGSQAIVRALPAITRALGEVGAELEKAVANLPSPTYPKR